MENIACTNLDAAIEQHKALGYRLDMIFPADNPRVCVMSKGDESLRLISGVRSPGFSRQAVEGMPPKGGTSSEWITGRAGMEYRALKPPKGGTPSEMIPDAVAVHHIRLTTGGEVPDYVHYHKIDFQMIYCKRGRIKVVYEDQGEPFWLETGDCVLQPPEIRHRVLECTAGAEVIEITMPAEHETWIEHNITLPTNELKPDRDFSGQRFFVTSLRTEDPGFPNEMVCKGFVERMKNAKAPDEILDAVTDVSRSLCRT